MNKNRLSLLRVIEDRRINILKATPTHLGILNSTGTKKYNLRKIIVGGEELKKTLASETSQLCRGGVNIYNEYGPTEATVGCMIYTYSDGDNTNKKSSSVSIGLPICNTAVFILDKYLSPVPHNVVGELHIAGNSLARGYLNQPILTAEKFIDITLCSLFFNHRKDYPTEVFQEIPGERSQELRSNSLSFRAKKRGLRARLYKTGDLAARERDGNIRFMGRVDRQVKIRGYRIEIQEIENRLNNMEGIEAAAVNVTAAGEICAYIVSSELDQIQLREDLSHRLPDYMIPSFFERLEKLPITASGKVDRKALPEPTTEVLLPDSNHFLYPAGEKEIQLLKIWEEVLGRRVKGIGIKDSFFKIGGHSLTAVNLAAKIKDKFQVEFPLSVIFERDTVKEQVEYIEQAGSLVAESVTLLEKKEYYPVSASQKGIFFLRRFDKEGMSYNMPGAVKIFGQLSMRHLQEVFKKLILRHESLRTSFHFLDGQPVQQVHPSRDTEFTVEFYQSDSLENAIDNFIRPFDLTRASLMRVGLFREENNSHILVVDMHHIISDGVSMVILVSEFINLYHEKRLPPLTIQYKDFSGWQHRFFKSDQFKKQESYWLNQLKGDLPSLTLPTDFPRPDIQTFQGQTINFNLEKSLSRKLSAITLETETTLYILLLAVFNILIFKYTQAENIFIGTPCAGRNHKELANIVGMFVNTLVMRNNPDNNLSFKDFLSLVKENALKGYENQDYPFDQLVNKLKIPKDMSRNPLLDILFVSGKVEIPELRAEGLIFTPYEFETRLSHMDMVVYVNEIDDEITISMEYSTALFKSSTIKKMIRHYREILEQVTSDLLINLGEIKLHRESVDLVSEIPQNDYINFGF
jgi:non-ribosomal peptide synthetase component F/acyl carrier protein